MKPDAYAYSTLYLNKSSCAVGNMLHDAVLEFEMDSTDFLKRFIQFDVAEQNENNNPKYIAEKSGLELFLEIMERTTCQTYTIAHLSKTMTEAMCIG